MNDLIKTPFDIGFYPVISGGFENDDILKPFMEYCYVIDNTDMGFKFLLKKKYNNKEYLLAPGDIRSIKITDKYLYFENNDNEIIWTLFVINNDTREDLQSYRNSSEMEKYIKKYFRKDYINYLKKRNIL